MTPREWRFRYLKRPETSPEAEKGKKIHEEIERLIKFSPTGRLPGASLPIDTKPRPKDEP